MEPRLNTAENKVNQDAERDFAKLHENGQDYDFEQFEVI